MRVLIVDDEIKVCQLIFHLVKWEDFGMEVIGSVNDGQKAYEVICREKPDIVITDIRMPNINGIELVERTLNQVGNIYYIIVSGYSEFEYAQQAVKLGVEDYLLKPIRKKELEMVLTKIEKKYNENCENENEKEILKSQLFETKGRVKSNLLTELLISKNETVSLLPKEEIEKQFGYCLPGKYNVFIIAHLFMNAMNSKNEEKQFILPKIQKSIETKLEDCCKEFTSIIYGEEVICLINVDDYSKDFFQKQLKKVNIDISNIREIFPYARISLGVGRKMESLKESLISINAIRNAMLKRFTSEENFLFWEESVETETAELEKIITSDIRKNLFRKIELIDGDGIEEVISEIKEKLQMTLTDGMLVKRCYDEVVDTFVLGVKQFQNQEKQLLDSFFVKGYNVFYSFSEAMDWLGKQCGDYLRQCAEKQKNLEDKPIRIARQYILEHYNEPIKLEMVSAIAGFNPAYFSSIFKKSTGQNFLDYVAEIRIENAKRLLVQSNKDIADIVNEVGYSDTKYFSKLFKKHTSLNPSEYRKLYS